ncbi:MAG: YlxR family protein [Chloroflexi bacterium]|nr:YlxR family protein [Chloroflexota bacterium]
MAAGTRPAPPRRLPERSCVACRSTRPKRDLVRVVRAPDGSVTVDPSGRAPGRGAYLCRDASCWDVAGRKRAIEHALKTAVPPGLAAFLAAGPDAPAATTTSSPRADGPRPSLNPDTMPRGEAHGQE